MVLLLLFELNILFAKIGILKRFKTYILHLHTHHTSYSTEHIPAKIGFAETIGFMQGRKPLIVSKGRTTGLVWWPAYTYTLLLQEWPALMQPPLVYGHQVARITLLRPQPCGKTS